MNDRLTLPILIAAALVILAVVFAPHVAYADDSETTAEATQVEDTAVIDTYASASIANGTYYFYSAIKNNLALDVNNNLSVDGNNIQLYGYNGNPSQQFTVALAKAESGKSWYTICMSGGKALALRGGATSAGTKVVLAQKTGMDSQLWTFIDAGDGYVRIVPKLAQSKAMETPKGCAVKKTSIEIGSGATPLSQLFKPSKTSILGKYCSAQAVSPTSSMPTKYSLALNKGSTSNIINTTGAPTLQVAYEAPNVGKFKTAIKISGPEQKGTVGRTFKRIGTYDGHSIDMTIVAVDWSDEELKPDAHLSVDSIYDVSYHGVYQVVWRYFFTESSSSQAVAISGFNTFLDIDGVERLESQWGMDYLWCLNTSSYERQSGYTAALTSTTGINSTDFTDDNYNVTGLFSNTSSLEICFFVPDYNDAPGETGYSSKQEPIVNKPDPVPDPDPNPVPPEPNRYTVSYYVDGSSSSIFSEQATDEYIYYASSSATNLATKPSCNGLDGWYTSPSYTSRYSPTILSGNLKLYARNKVLISFAYATNSQRTDSTKTYYSKKDSSSSYKVASALNLPSSINTYYGMTVTLPATRTPLYSYEYGVNDSWRWRTYRAYCWYSDAAGKSSSSTTISRIGPVTSSRTLYIDWRRSTIDGVEDS